MTSDPEKGISASEGVEVPVEAPKSRRKSTLTLIGLDLLRSWRQHKQARDDPIVVEQDTVENIDEQGRAGYPAYSFLLGHHPGFQTFRRFRTVRMRMLLLKQDEISKLEERLDKLDEAEKSELFLGSCRFDKNEERKQVFKQLDDALAIYDSFVQRSQWALHVAEPISRELRMQQIWLRSKNYIARKETMYIDHNERELMNIGLVKDQSMASMARAVGLLIDIFYRVGYMIFSSRNHQDSSRTTMIPNAFIRSLARALAASLAIILLLVPIIILNAVERTLIRFIVLFISSTFFVAVVTVASQATLGEIFAAGAAYTAVLVVFVSGNGVSGTPSTTVQGAG